MRNYREKNVYVFKNAPKRNRDGRLAFGKFDTAQMVDEVIKKTGSRKTVRQVDGQSRFTERCKKSGHEKMLTSRIKGCGKSNSDN